MTVIDRVKRFLWNRQHNYRIVFNSPPGQIVLADLASFCRSRSSTFDVDARVHAMAEGRREVWLRIQNHLNLTQKKLYELSTGEIDDAA